MVLRDSSFPDTLLEDYLAALGPKASLAPRDSQTTALGIPTETLSLGIASHEERRRTSFDLCMILSVGIAAENPEIAERLRSGGYVSIRDAELLSVLKYHCDRALPLASSLKAQVVICTETPGSLWEKGIMESFRIPRPLFRNLYLTDNRDAGGADVMGCFENFQ
ncbi:hypothetical protein DL764_007891 [Monosporascus ibericus]|uniref:Uncharacterized protein n=1 Tax=Monosporascus ibericus TaxID=155417 RepID=A0A4Q4SYW4_9PEZI|nr:hypothetical protein DL764_007891 [Monosporascus ibericus]